MGWSEFRRIPNEYNEDVKAIDEEILKLISTRTSLTHGKRFFPTDDTLNDWSIRFDMEIPQIQFILHNLNGGNRIIVPNEPGEILQVLPIMKKSIVDHCEYVLTHAMQHELMSIVSVEIKYTEEDRHEIQIKPNLILEIISDREYSVHRNGNRGGGPHSQMQFIITPPLPENLDQTQFSLVPCALYSERKIREIKLEKQIDF